MRPPGPGSCLFLLLILCTPFTGEAQAWEFIKVKDGIRIYTRQEEGKSLKSYKGMATLNAPAEKIFALIEDVYNTEWWDKNFNQITVTLYEKHRRARYYLVYDLPWPVTDRDLSVDVVAKADPVAGVFTITSVPLPNTIPPKKELIRITEYRQTWTVTRTGPSTSSVVLEGYLDPAGTIPDWLSNMLIVDSPLKVIGEVKKRVEKP